MKRVDGGWGREREGLKEREVNWRLRGEEMKVREDGGEGSGN